MRCSEFGVSRPLRRRQLIAGVLIDLGRALDLLLVLLEADGSLVSKDELLSRVWPGIVVAEENLKVQISALRKALGQDRDFIRTESGRGYRFTAAIRSTVARGAGQRPRRGRHRSSERLRSSMDFSANAALVCPRSAAGLAAFIRGSRCGLDWLSCRKRRRNVVIRSLSAIFNQAITEPAAPKTPLWKAAAFAAGLGLSMLSYPVHAAPSSGGDTVQGLYDALLNTMKNGRTLGLAGASRNSTRLSASPTSLQWRDCRLARPERSDRAERQRVTGASDATSRRSMPTASTYSGQKPR
jgi:DNA-binding winged helix-turn-helix (wHTH) protein